MSDTIKNGLLKYLESLKFSYAKEKKVFPNFSREEKAKIVNRVLQKYPGQTLINLKKVFLDEIKEYQKEKELLKVNQQNTSALTEGIPSDQKQNIEESTNSEEKILEPVPTEGNTGVQDEGNPSDQSEDPTNPEKKPEQQLEVPLEDNERFFSPFETSIFLEDKFFNSEFKDNKILEIENFDNTNTNNLENNSENNLTMTTATNWTFLMQQIPVFSGTASEGDKYRDFKEKCQAAGAMIKDGEEEQLVKYIITWKISAEVKDRVILGSGVDKITDLFDALDVVYCITRSVEDIKREIRRVRQGQKEHYKKFIERVDALHHELMRSIRLSYTEEERLGACRTAEVDSKQALLGASDLRTTKLS